MWDVIHQKNVWGYSICVLFAVVVWDSKYLHRFRGLGHLWASTERETHCFSLLRTFSMFLACIRFVTRYMLSKWKQPNIAQRKGVKNGVNHMDTAVPPAYHIDLYRMLEMRADLKTWGCTTQYQFSSSGRLGNAVQCASLVWKGSASGSISSSVEAVSVTVNPWVKFLHFYSFIWRSIELLTLRFQMQWVRLVIHSPMAIICFRFDLCTYIVLQMRLLPLQKGTRSVVSSE